MRLILILFREVLRRVSNENSARSKLHSFAWNSLFEVFFYHQVTEADLSEVREEGGVDFEERSLQAIYESKIIKCY